MSKEHFIAAHERLVEEYMLKHRDASWDEAYEKTADLAYGRMRDDLVARVDEARLRAKERS